ncbi:hypothetical protein ACFRAI_44935, partial [Streptomyces sp. NPDC056637]
MDLAGDVHAGPTAGRARAGSGRAAPGAPGAAPPGHRAHFDRTRAAEAAHGADQGAAVKVKDVRRLDRVIIRFAGDSGDGMQLTGDRFTSETAS